MNKEMVILKSIEKLGIVYFYKKIKNKIEIIGFTKIKSAILFSEEGYQVCPYMVSKRLKDLGVCYEDAEIFD